MTTFDEWRSRLRRLAPAEVLQGVAYGWQHGPVANVNLGAIPVEEDPGRAVRKFAGLVDDLRRSKATGEVATANDPALVALTWIATPTAGAWVLDYEAHADRRRRSAILAVVADDEGDPLALIRGADGGRALGAPPHPFAGELFHAVRDAASRFALGCVVDGAATKLDPTAVEELVGLAVRLADRLDGLNSARRTRQSAGSSGRPPSQQDGGWLAAGWTE